MFEFDAGAKPVLALCALAAAVSLGGCAADRSAEYSAAVSEPKPVARLATDIEDDGIAAQTPPSRSIRQQPDDPSEPYSRNYGGVNPSSARASDRPDPMTTAPSSPSGPDRAPTTWQPKVVILVQDE